ncbi:sensor histidine kinase [Mycobacterium sp. C31M]
MSEQQVITSAQDISVVLLNSVTAVAAGSAILLPNTPETDFGFVALLLLFGWAAYRLLTRSRATLFQILDLCYVLAVAAAVPIFVTEPQLLYTNSVPQVIAGTAVIVVAVAQPPRFSLPAAVAITAAYAIGCAQVVGWDQVASVPMLYYMLLIEWPITTALIATALEVARRVDQTRADNHDAELRDAIAAAVRDHELEHMALVHDTAASTLHLVGEGAEISPERIAAQARRDLALLSGEPSAPDPDAAFDIVAAIAAEIAHVPTPVQLTGLTRLVLDGRTANAVVAVVRESLNNAERHARAKSIVIDIAPKRVTVTDDGIGFDPVNTTLGHGVAESIMGRMRRAKGTASVRSTPGKGTVVTINWQQPLRTTPEGPSDDDVDQLTERILFRFGMGIVLFALLQLTVAVPYAAANSGHAVAQFGLGAVAALVVVAGIPRILGRGPNLTVPALIVMAGVVFVQAQLLPEELRGGPAQWTLLATTLCVLPYLLRMSLPAAAGVIIGFWIGTSVMNFVQEPTMATAYNLALYTAGVTVVQMFLLAFPVLLREANSTAAEEVRERWAKDAQRRISEALHDDYVRRTSRLIRGVFPLLQTLSTGTIDADIQWRARIESRRLRLYIFQARTFGHPLIAELRSAIEDADLRGVVVSLNADNDLPRLDPDVRRQLLEPIETTLAGARDNARLGISVVPGEVVASIICDDGGSGIASQPGDAQSPRIEVTEIGDTIWVSVHHRLSPADVSADDCADIA